MAKEILRVGVTFNSLWPRAGFKDSTSTLKWMILRVLVLSFENVKLNVYY